MQVGTQDIELKNRNKILFPNDDISKGDLIDYYGRISEFMIPFLEDRPLTLSRFPDGIHDSGFYQKDMPDYFPEWISAKEIRKKEGGSNKQVVCNKKETLIYLANQATVSFHPWLSKISDVYKPDRMIFDLDPPEGKFNLAVDGARALRTVLEKDLGIPAFVMTTGSKGLHVVCPIKPSNGFNEVRKFAKNVAVYVAGENSDSFTTKSRKNQRNGRLFIDYLRNAYAQTSVAPFSVRARKGAPVATPLEWDELGKSGLSSGSYHMKNIFKRLSQKEDPWGKFHHKTSGIGEGEEKLTELMNG